MTWCIDGHRIEIDNQPVFAYVVVDGQRVGSFLANTLARYPIPWRDRSVEMRWVRNLDVARGEIWVDGECVPPSALGMREAAAGSRCQLHGRAAERCCAKCDAVSCDQCLAADAVRCKTCFAGAAREATRSVKASRRAGLVFFLILTGVSLLLFLTTEALIFWKVASGLFALGTFIFVRGLYLERKERKLGLGTLPLMVELDEVEPQLAGRSCIACQKRVATANSATYCAECRTFRHTKCEDGHSCAPSATGPDWWALRELAKTPAAIKAKQTFAALKKAS